MSKEISFKVEKTDKDGHLVSEYKLTISEKHGKALLDLIYSLKDYVDELEDKKEQKQYEDRKAEPV